MSATVSTRARASVAALLAAATLALSAAPVMGLDALWPTDVNASSHRLKGLPAPGTSGEPLRLGDMPNSGLPCVLLFNGGAPLFQCASLAGGGLSLSGGVLKLTSIPNDTAMLGDIIVTGTSAVATPAPGTGSCRYDATNMTWACLSAFGIETHGVQTSLPGGNFVIGIGPDGYVYRGGVSATQVAGLWPVAITGNGSDLNPASTPLDRLAQSGATTGQVASWNGTTWVPATAATGGITQLTGQVLAGPGSGSQATTLATNTVTLAQMQQLAGLSLLGRSASSTGNMAAITATSGSNGVFRESGGALGFGNISASVLSGLVPCGNLPALTGDVTSVGCATTVANLPNGTTWSGWMHPTNTTLVGTPGAGTSYVWVDSTAKTLFVRDDAGNVSHGVRTSSAGLHQFVNGLSDTGVLSYAQPVAADVSGLAAIATSGSATDLITGTVAPARLGSFTNGSALFWNSGLAQDNANFFWDSTLHRLGLGTTAPGAPLQITGTASAAMEILSNPTASSFVQFMLKNDQFATGSAGLELVGSTFSGGVPGNGLLIYNQVGDITIQPASGTAALNLTAAGNVRSASLTGGSDALVYATAANGQLARVSLSGLTLSGGVLTVPAVSWPTAGDVVTSTGTGPTGVSTFTLAAGALTIGSSNGGAAAIALNQAAQQDIAKTGGRFDVGTTDANLFTLMTNNVSRLLLSSTGALQLTAYGAGHLQTDASGNVTVDATTYQPLVSFPASPQIAIGTGTGLTGASTFTLTLGALTIGSSNGSGYAIALNQAADQQINKTGGNLYVGASASNNLYLYAGGTTREALSPGGVVEGINLAGASWTTSATPIVPASPTVLETSLTPPSTASAATLQGLYRYDGVTETLTGTTHVTSHEGGLYLAANTLTSSTAITVDQAATLTVAGPWTCAGSVTCTSRPAVLVKSGHLEVDGSDANGYGIVLNQSGTQAIAKGGGRLDVGTTGAFMTTLMAGNLSRVVALSTGEVQIPNLAGGSDALVYANAASGQLTRVGLGSGLSLSGGTLSATGTITWPSTNQVVYSTGTAPAGDAGFVWDPTNHRLVLNTSDANAATIVLNKAGQQEITKTGGRFDVGTTDANLVTLMTNNLSRLVVAAAGNVQITNNLEVDGITTNTMVRTDGSHNLVPATAGTDYVQTASATLPVVNGGTAANPNFTLQSGHITTGGGTYNVGTSSITVDTYGLITSATATSSPAPFDEMHLLGASFNGLTTTSWLVPGQTFPDQQAGSAPPETRLAFIPSKVRLLVHNLSSAPSSSCNVQFAVSKSANPVVATELSVTSTTTGNTFQDSGIVSVSATSADSWGVTLSSAPSNMTGCNFEVYVTAYFYAN